MLCDYGLSYIFENIEYIDGNAFLSEFIVRVIDILILTVRIIIKLNFIIVQY